MTRALGDTTDTTEALRELRLYACMVRDATMTARRTCERLLESEVGTGSAADAAVCLVHELGTVAEKLRKVYDDVGGFGVLLVFCFDYVENPEAWHRSMRLLAEEVMPMCADLVPDAVTA